MTIFKNLSIFRQSLHLIRRMEWRHFEFSITDTKQIKVRNCENDARDELDLKDRIIKMSAGFGYLIVITPNQCYIYRFIFYFELVY
jgi:hypothetical protein